MKTIQDLIDFFEAIPSERWTKNMLSSWSLGETEKPEQNCAFGHLNKHLTGDWKYSWSDDVIESWLLVTGLGIDPCELIYHNNYGKSDAKTNVINFLKEKPKEMVTC